MKAPLIVFSVVLASTSVFGQTPKPEFEVASIKPSTPATGAINAGVHIDGARVSCTQLSLNDFIGMAYRVKRHQIVGPEWLASDRYDINATLPEGAKREQVPDMIKSLLESRFGMKMHRDTKEFAVYGITVAKGGLKMKESAPDENAGAEPRKSIDVKVSGNAAGTTLDYGNGSYFTFGNNRFEAKKLTMTAFADTLARFADRPVVDMTELKGAYDLSAEFSPEDFRAMMIRAAIAAGITLPPQALMLLEHANGDSLPAALQTLGLKMEPRKAPIEVLVIDHAEKNPTEN